MAPASKSSQDQPAQFAVPVAASAVAPLVSTARPAVAIVPESATPTPLFLTGCAFRC